MPSRDLPFGRVDVGGRQHGAHVFQAQPEIIQQRGIRPRRARPAARCRRRTPGPRPSPAKCFCCRMVDAASYIWPGVMVVEVSPSCRIGGSAGFTLRQYGFCGRFGRKLAARRVDGRLHVARRRVDVAVQIELQRDAGRAERARRRHFVHARRCARIGARAASPPTTPWFPDSRRADCVET